MVVQVDIIYEGDNLTSLQKLSSDSVDCVITSPPYFGLRDYGLEGQIGLEETPKAYIRRLVGVFREVRRVLKSSGTLWLVMGDTYAGGGRGGGTRAWDYFVLGGGWTSLGVYDGVSPLRRVGGSV